MLISLLPSDVGFGDNVENLRVNDFIIPEPQASCSKSKLAKFDLAASLKSITF